MSGFVFVLDAEERPLMPMAPAYARKLLRQGKATWFPHHAFTVIQLSRAIALPTLRPIVVGIRMHLHTAELVVVAKAPQGAFSLLHVIIDLRTDLTWRLRRRAEHRQRRRARGRYRSQRHYGRPFKLRRPSRARDRRYQLSIAAHKARYVRRYVPATMRWRAQAIARTITALQRILPISHVVLAVSPAQVGVTDLSSSATTLRQRLIKTYGIPQTDGSYIPVCAYCGTTQGRIEVEHIVPRSRGGTDGWNNRVLACTSCNARKGERTPEEAGMQLRVSLNGKLGQTNRSGAYVRQTAATLTALLAQMGLKSLDYHHLLIQPGHLLDAHEQLLLRQMNVPPKLPCFVAKPIGRPVKQVFSARNYPLSTPIRSGFVHVGSTMKRRVRVNQALQLPTGRSRRPHVIPVGTALPPGETRLVTQGMLCEGRRAEQTLTGIVGAIHSTGRVTLVVLDQVQPANITWKRIVVSAGQHLRVITSERVVFLNVDTDLLTTDSHSL